MDEREHNIHEGHVVIADVRFAGAKDINARYCKQMEAPIGIANFPVGISENRDLDLLFDPTVNSTRDLLRVPGPNSHSGPKPPQ